MNRRSAPATAVVVAASVLVSAACHPTQLSDVTLAREGGSHVTPATLASESSWTVLVFFARSCPCFSAHEARLRDLARDFGPKGVRFVAVQSEGGETLEGTRDVLRARGLPFEAVLDPGGKAADALGAEFATYTVVLGRDGAVLYRGGIDTDKRDLHADTTPYLRLALEDVTSGRAPRIREGKALGCVLRR